MFTPRGSDCGAIMVVVEKVESRLSTSSTAPRRLSPRPAPRARLSPWRTGGGRRQDVARRPRARSSSGADQGRAWGGAGPRPRAAANPREASGAQEMRPASRSRNTSPGLKGEGRPLDAQVGVLGMCGCPRRCKRFVDGAGDDRVRSCVRPRSAALPRAAGRYGDTQTKTASAKLVDPNCFSWPRPVRSVCPYRSSTSLIADAPA
jgi:hypothetical protein